MTHQEGGSGHAMPGLNNQETLIGLNCIDRSDHSMIMRLNFATWKNVPGAGLSNHEVQLC